MKRILLSRERDCLLKRKHRLRNSGHHIVRRQWPPDALQLELAHGLDFHGVLDRYQHTGADQYLPGFASSQSREATLETVPMAA